MGQTLTHGIYLPDEGERNCYNGLAANWQLLDGAVGTVAEHTTQIAGKAPAVHTHTVSQITDFPAYGNAAGTICEGNDSRLSDARTPVAHTHTKSEITDFPTNVSAFTNDSGYANDSDVVHKSGNETVAGNKTFAGTSNKFNSQTVTYLNAVTLGVKPTNDQLIINYHEDSNSEYIAHFRTAVYNTGDTRIELGVRNKFSNGQLDQNGSLVSTFYGVGLDSTGVPYVIWNCGVRGDVYPYGTRNLGTTTNRWKTLNGVNPGALSLPNVNAVTGSSNTQLQDISGDLVQDQYFNCYFTPRMDGWAYIYLDCSNATIRSGCSSYTVSAKTARGIANALYSQAFTKNENSWRSLQIFIPVTANKEITLELTFTGFSVSRAYVIPAQGNV